MGKFSTRLVSKPAGFRNNLQSWDTMTVMSINTKIIELEPAWIFVIFDGPKPDPSQRAFWLNRALTDWLGDHPGRVVTRTLPVQHQGNLVAILVWFDSPDAISQGKGMLRIDKSLVGALPKEHMEATLQSAYEIFFRHPQVPRLIIVNRSKTAVVFDRAREQVTFVPLERLNLIEQDKAAVEKWLATRGGKHLVIQLPA